MNEPTAESTSSEATAPSHALALRPAAAARPEPPAGPHPGRWPGAPLTQSTCMLCGHVAAVRLRADSRCSRCDAPLATLPEPGRTDHELFGRRDAVRRDQSHVATLHIGWPSPALPVRWRDLSLTGLSIYTAGPVAEGSRIHLIDQALEAVAEVVDCRPQGRLFVVRGRLLAAVLLQATGVFVSTRA